jgi:5-methylthioadenosine/S-adenosylhomocysteine deaminase
VSMGDSIGVLPIPDVLIEDGYIKDVGADLARVSPSTDVIDASGRIIIPGFANAHMRTWQTGLRSMPNWTLLEYFRWTHAGLATHHRPSDIYLAAQAGPPGGPSESDCQNQGLSLVHPTIRGCRATTNSN